MNNILDIMLTRMLVSFSRAYLYEQTDIKIAFPNGMNFAAAGKSLYH